MKRCPTCNSTFSDNRGKFCPADGSTLVDMDDPRATDPSTLDSPAPTLEPHVELTDTIDGVTLLAQPPVSATEIMPARQRTGSGSKTLLYIGTALAGFVIIGVVAGLIISYTLVDTDNKNPAIAKNPDNVVPELSTSATPRSTPTPTPDPPLDIDGTWTGTFDKASATMSINKKDDNSFTGTITSKEFQISIAGRYDPDSRKIDFKETKVLRSEDDRKPGTNSGRVSGNGRRMRGKGKSTKEYTWSFTKSRS